MYNIYSENLSDNFLKITEICLSFYNGDGFKIVKNSKKMQKYISRKNQKNFLEGMCMENLIEEFKRKMYLEGKSERTVEVYSNSVKEYFRWFYESYGDVEYKRLYRENILEYKSYLTLIVQTEEVEEDNCPANINKVTDNKVDVNQIRYDAESGSLYVGRINEKIKYGINFCGTIKIETVPFSINCL